MKLRRLISHLESNDRVLVREVGRHSFFFNPDNKRTSSVSRHVIINDFLAFISQIPDKRIKECINKCMTQVRCIIRRDAAHIKLHIARCIKSLFLAGH